MKLNSQNDKMNCSSIDDELQLDLENYIESMWNFLPIPVIYVNVNGIIIESNNALSELIGIKNEKILSEKITKIMPELTIAHKQTLRGKELKNQEITIITIDKKKLTLVLSTKLRTDSKKRKIGYFISLIDITKQKEDNEIIKQNQVKYKYLYDNSLNFLATVDLTGNIIEMNPTALNKMLEIGYKKNELIGLNIRHIIDKKDLPLVLKSITMDFLGKTSNSIEVKVIGKNDKFIYVTFAPGSTPIYDDKGHIKALQVTGSDTTQRKKFEEDLINSEKKFKSIFESAPDSYYLSDFKGVIFDGNKAAEELLGYKKQELIGSSFLKLGIIKKTDLPKAVMLLAKNFKGEPTGPDEINLIDKKGVEKIVEIRTTVTMINNKRMILGNARDITQRKKTEELLQKQKEIREISKLKNKFLMRISHELRHPLVPIVGYSTVMLEENPSIIQRNYLEKILFNANQLKELINKTLELISFESGEALIQPVKVNIKSLIKELVNDYKTKAEIKLIKITNEIKDNITLKIDENKIKIAISNILDNAIKFTDKGSININSKKEGNNLIIAITDTGKGMTEEELNKLFTYREEDENYDLMYKGLGIGLLLSKYIINAHKGELTVESKPNKGTKIIIKLPLGVKMNGAN